MYREFFHPFSPYLDRSSKPWRVKMTSRTTWKRSWPMRKLEVAPDAADEEEAASETFDLAPLKADFDWDLE